MNDLGDPRDTPEARAAVMTELLDAVRASLPMFAWSSDARAKAVWCLAPGSIVWVERQGAGYSSTILLASTGVAAHPTPRDAVLSAADKAARSDGPQARAIGHAVLAALGVVPHA